MERSPVGSIIVRNANVFDPKTIIELKDLELINRLKVLTSHLISLKWFDGPYGDKVMGQYRLLENEVKDKKEKFQKYKREDCSVDDFFFFRYVKWTQRNIELMKVMKIVFILSHGQSAVERSFSFGKPFVVDNISETSLIYKKLIKDHLISNKVSADNIHISRELVQDFKASRMKYDLYLEEKKKEKEKTAKENQKSIIKTEINSVKSKIVDVQKSVLFLQNESFEAMKNAKEKKDMSYAMKANALKRKSDESKEVKTLEKALSILEEKHAKL